MHACLGCLLQAGLHAVLSACGCGQDVGGFLFLCAWRGVGRGLRPAVHGHAAHAYAATSQRFLFLLHAARLASDFFAHGIGDGLGDGGGVSSPRGEHMERMSRILWMRVANVHWAMRGWFGESGGEVVGAYSVGGGTGYHYMFWQGAGQPARHAAVENKGRGRGMSISISIQLVLSIYRGSTSTLS